MRKSDSNAEMVTDNELAQIALAAARNSHSPYSRFPVGAALIANGELFTGTNVENSSSGLTVCAERVAVCTAVAKGKKKLERIAIASPNHEFITPCGACRQVLSEFCDDLKIILVKRSGETQKTTLKKLLPRPFKRKK
jgi:cytidine deaminase